MDEPVRWRDALAIVATFNFVSLCWVFFRADSLPAALAYVTGLASLRPGAPDPELLGVFLPLAVAAFLVDVVQRNSGDEVAFLRLPAPAFGAVIGAFVAALVVFSGESSEPFIYFQF